MAKDEKKQIGEVILKNVRLSYAHLDKPQKDSKNDAGEIIKGKFGASLLMKKGTPETKAMVAKIKAASEEVKAAKWGNNPPKFKPERVCLRDGDLEDWDGYENHLYVSTSNNQKPTVVDKSREPVEPGDKQWPYSGCYVNAVIRIWAQNNEADKGGKRINASLEAIQFKAHGKPFSSAKPVDVNSAFDDESEEDEQEFDEEDEDETPKKKAKKRPVDEDDDEDDDAPPKKKKKRPVDEDDDDDLI